MVPIGTPTGEDPRSRDDGHNRHRRDFPPLREDVGSSEGRRELIQEEMARHQDVLAERTDS